MTRENHGGAAAVHKKTKHIQPLKRFKLYAMEEKNVFIVVYVRCILLLH